jgi:predicted MFS family arabinose efflux permease
MLLTISFGVPFNFLPLKCAANGISAYQTALILSMMGVADIVGRLVTSFIGHKVDVTLIYIISTALIGFSLIAVSMMETFPTILATSVLATLGFGKYLIVYTC